MATIAIKNPTSGRVTMGPTRDIQIGQGPGQAHSNMMERIRRDRAAQQAKGQAGPIVIPKDWQGGPGTGSLRPGLIPQGGTDLSGLARRGSGSGRAGGNPGSGSAGSGGAGGQAGRGGSGGGAAGGSPGAGGNAGRGSGSGNAGGGGGGSGNAGGSGGGGGGGGGGGRGGRGRRGRRGGWSTDGPSSWGRGRTPWWDAGYWWPGSGTSSWWDPGYWYDPEPTVIVQDAPQEPQQQQLPPQPTPGTVSMNQALPLMIGGIVVVFALMMMMFMYMQMRKQ